MIKLKNLIKEVRWTEDEIGAVMRIMTDDLVAAIKKAEKGKLGPEGWAEKYHRSSPKAIDMMERLISIFNKM